MDWSGLVCLVTGASSGIGRAIAVDLAGRGATVIASARREERLLELVDEIGGSPHSYVVCDVGNLDSVRELAATVAERTDHLDVLVNNAGMPGPGVLAEASAEQVEKVIRTNVTGTIWCVQVLERLLVAAPKTARTPVIVNVASIAGRIPVPGAATYTASKFALVGFSEALASEMGRKGVKVMGLNPGLVHTEGFPMDRVRALRTIGWTVMNPPRIAAAMARGIETGRAQLTVQGWWSLIFGVLFVLGPLRRRLLRRFQSMVTNRTTI